MRSCAMGGTTTAVCQAALASMDLAPTSQPAAAPRQVFEYFASIREDRTFAMTAGDMLRSVVPVYPPEGSEVLRAGSLPGEPSPHVRQEEVSTPARS
jgi:hypothetical protein